MFDTRTTKVRRGPYGGFRGLGGMADSWSPDHQDATGTWVNANGLTYSGAQKGDAANASVPAFDPFSAYADQARAAGDWQIANKDTAAWTPTPSESPTFSAGTLDLFGSLGKSLIGAGTGIGGALLAQSNPGRQSPPLRANNLASPPGPGFAALAMQALPYVSLLGGAVFLWRLVKK